MILRYVSTFVFTRDLGRVVLVQKKRGPEFLRNRWTAIGGHIEPIESSDNAAVREVREEAGIEVKELKYFASIKRGEGGGCAMYAGYVDDHSVTSQLTDELINVFFLSELRHPEVVPHLAPDTSWLVQMALAALKGDETTYEIEAQ